MYDRKQAGIRMQELRKQKGVTQQEMGDALCFTRSKVSSLETAKRDICMTDAVSVCDYLEVGLETLFFPKTITSNDFLVLATKYASNKNIPQKERRETLKKIMKYL